MHHFSFPPKANALFQEVHFQFQKVRFNDILVTGAIAIGQFSSYGFAFVHKLNTNVFDQQARMWGSMYGPKMRIPTN